MRTYTAHLKPGRPPVLLRESWSWGAAVFGPLWLLAHRAWIPAVFLLAVLALLGAFASPAAQAIGFGGLFVLGGLLGRDMVRWSLDRRGYLLTHVLAAASADGALARLLEARTDIAARYLEQLG